MLERNCWNEPIERGTPEWVYALSMVAQTWLDAEALGQNDAAHFSEKGITSFEHHRRANLLSRAYVSMRRWLKDPALRWYIEILGGEPSSVLLNMEAMCRGHLMTNCLARTKKIVFAGYRHSGPASNFSADSRKIHEHATGYHAESLRWDYSYV